MKKPLGDLQLLQKEVIDIVSAISEKNYPQQFHPDLSPIGWHLGHCIYTESYWIREQLLNQQSIDEALKSLYVPELSKKQSRGAALPDKHELVEWARTIQTENIELLISAIHNPVPHQLLENNYLLYFLIQHYSQHIETMHMVLTEMQLQQLNGDVALGKKLIPGKPDVGTKTIAAGIYNIGSDEKSHAYDNEQPTHSVSLSEYTISTRPISNGEYLQFIVEGVYSEKKHWSGEGWQWINKNQYKHPHHWRLCNNDHYFGVNHNGIYALEESHPVYGISYYEALAYANWVGARLPHEYEWEMMAINNSQKQTSLVWEWCSNTFHPYKNFSAYPYKAYSVPYFDEKHYVLRGGSIYTKEHIKRPSFRNYYTPDKRHIFAGFRLVYD